MPINENNGRRRVWSKEETYILTKIYSTASQEELKNAFPQFSTQCIWDKAKKLKIKKENIHYWDKTSISILRKIYPNSTKQEIIKQLPSFEWQAIRKKAYKLKIKRDEKSPVIFHKWTKEEDDLLKKLYPWAEPEELYGKIKLTLPAIAHRAMILGIKRKRRVSFDKKRRGFVYTSHITGEKFNATLTKGDNGGYVVITINGRNVVAHRYEMEHKLKRKLLKTEDVHHLDGDKQNNHPDNLVVTPRKEHKRFNTMRANVARKFLVKKGIWEEYIEFENKNKDDFFTRNNSIK